MRYLKYAAYILTLVGALNWGLVGIFGYNLIGSLFGDMTVLSRIIYSLVGLSAIVTALTMHHCDLIEEDSNCQYGQCNL